MVNIYLGGFMKDFKEEAFPNIYNIIETKHYIKGRIRLKVKKLKCSNTKDCNDLIMIFKQLKDIKNIKIEPIIGSIVIEFDESILPVETLVETIIKILDLENEIQKPKVGVIDQKVGELLKEIDIRIYNKTNGIFSLKSVVFLKLIILGVWKIRRK